MSLRRPGGQAARPRAGGRAIVLSPVRRQIVTFRNGIKGMAILHPSALLRIPDAETRHRAFEEFVADLRFAADRSRKASS